MVRKHKFRKQSFKYRNIGNGIELSVTAYVGEFQVKGTERVGRSIGYTPPTPLTPLTPLSLPHRTETQGEVLDKGGRRGAKNCRRLRHVLLKGAHTKQPSGIVG